MKDSSQAKDIFSLSKTVAVLVLLYCSLVLPFLAHHRSFDLPILTLIFLIGICKLQPATASVRKIEPLVKKFPSLLVLGVLSIAAFFRLSDLNYNGPYMDELLNMEVKTVGNVHYIASDTRFWPVLGYYSNLFFGLQGMRALNAVLGMSSVLALFFLSRSIFRSFKIDERSQAVPLLAALIFAISPAHIFISKIATHDSLAVLFFISAFTLLAEGISRTSKTYLLSSAFLFLLSFASRYFIIISFPSIPLFLLFVLSERREEKGLFSLLAKNFIFPSLFFFLTYSFWNLHHVASSVRLAIWQSGGESNAGFRIVCLAMLLRVLPLLIPWGLAGILKIVLRVPNRSQSNALRAFLFLSAMVLPLTHLLKSSDYGMEKNLTYAYIFGSLLVSYDVVSALSLVQERKRLTSFLFTIAATILLSLSTSLLIHPATRPEIPMQKALAHLKRDPIIGSVLASVELDQSRWFQPKPVFDELERLGLHHQRVAVHGNFGGTHINWYLNHWMGRDEKTGKYYADSGTAWKKDTFLYAHERKIPLIVAIIPEAELVPYERILNYPDYRLEGMARIAESEGNYGRVFVFLNPKWLELENIPEQRRSFYQAERNAVLELPAKGRALDEPGSTALTKEILDAEKSLGTSPESFALLLDLAEAKAVQGQSDEAKRLFREAEELSAKLPESLHFTRSVDLRRDRQRVYRGSDSFEMESLAESKPVSLLQRGVFGETPKEEIPRSTGKSHWLDFSPCVPLNKNDLLLIQTELRGSQVQAFRLLDEKQDYGEIGDLHVLPFSQGPGSYGIRIEKELCLKRFDIQIGPEAWGNLGGTMGAEVYIKALSLAQTKLSAWYR